MSESLGEIEIGFTREQATAIVIELDALVAHSNVMGKRSMDLLHLFRACLLAALRNPEEPAKPGGTI